MPELLVVGGGAVGLALAYEIAGQGWKVRVIDRGQPGRETSWAAAGILPGSKFRMKAPAQEWLQGYSSQLHAEWATRLREETGIDYGFRRCGAIYLAETKSASGELLQNCERWRREGLTTKWLQAGDLDKFEPALAGAYDRFPLDGAAFLAEEIQIRSPRYCQALLAACQKRGVQISAGVELYDFEVAGGRVTAVQTSAGAIAVDRIVLTAGAWSQPLANRLGARLTVKPMRGQIVLLNSAPVLSRIINATGHYFVPRDDGRVLVGTTMEDVGFDRRNTAEALADILAFAARLCPVLKPAAVETAWCGFRPASIDGWPYLAAAPGVENAFIATGHYRSGVWLSTGTAVVMSRLIRGESPGVDLTLFRVDRGSQNDER